MNNIINNRKQVYSNLPSTKLNSSLANIVLEYDINSDLYQKLTQAVQQFICKSMALAYDQEFSWTPDFLEKNNKLLAELPNKTPNGIINPKKETSQEFTLIQNILNQILDDLELYPHIDQLLPFNIRYKSPIETDETKSRPYYTGKYHSDAWVGHVGDSQFLIGVLGDINNNTVEFTEPTNVLDTYLDKASTFEEGQTRYSGFNHLGFLTKQKLAIMDHACLHRTYMKEGAYDEDGENGLAQSYSVELNIARPNDKTLRALAVWAEPVSNILEPDSPVSLNYAVNKSLASSERISAICGGEEDIPAE